MLNNIGNIGNIRNYVDEATIFTSKQIKAVAETVDEAIMRHIKTTAAPLSCNAYSEIFVKIPTDTSEKLSAMMAEESYALSHGKPLY